MVKSSPVTVPPHPDVEIARVQSISGRHLRIDTFRFKHRLFSGDWSAERSYEVLRRGQAVAIVLYDPDHDRVVLVEQVRLPALLAVPDRIAMPTNWRNAIKIVPNQII